MHPWKALAITLRLVVRLCVSEIPHESAVEAELFQRWNSLTLGLHADVLCDASVQHVLDVVVGQHAVDIDRVSVTPNDII